MSKWIFYRADVGSHVAGKNYGAEICVALVGAMLVGITPLGVGAAVNPPILERQSPTSQTQEILLVAESERRYNKRGARRAWVKFKREAGPRGRADLRQKAGQRTGWVKRLREAQRKRAEREARGKAAEEKGKQGTAPKSTRQRRQKLNRIHVID